MLGSTPRPSPAPASLVRAALRLLVHETSAGVGPRPWEGDLGKHQTVLDYSRDPALMRRYTHMYAGKHVAAWSALRARLGWGGLQDRPLVSLGAGPMLCLAGWLHGHGPHADVRAIDVLDWSPVTGSVGGEVLQLAVGSPAVRSGVYAPMGDGPPPAQLAHLDGIRALRPGDIPPGATVLMPMMLNHLLEEDAVPAQTLMGVRRMFRHLQDRGCRIVVADLQHRKSSRLWDRLAVSSGAHRPPSTLAFADTLARQRDLYSPMHAGYRTSARMARLSVLAWDGQRWQGVS